MRTNTKHNPPGSVRRREAIAFAIALVNSNVALLAVGVHPSMEKVDTKFWVITASICTTVSIVALYIGTDKGTFNTQRPLVALTLLAIGIGIVLPWLFAVYCRKPMLSLVGGVLFTGLAFCGYMVYREEKQHKLHQKPPHTKQRR